MTGATGATTLPPPNTDAAALGEARRRVEDLVCGIPGGDPDQLGFEHPWEIRAFALAVAAYHELGFDWSEFQHALIASIGDWEAAAGAGERAWSYYEHWVTALERVLASADLTSPPVLDERTRAVLAVPPNRGHHEAHPAPIAVDPPAHA